MKPPGCQVIAEGVEHDVARTEADRKQRACATPGIVLPPFRLEDRTGRGEQPRERARRLRNEAAEGRRRLVQGGELRLAQHRQARQRRSVRHRSRIEASQPFRIGGRGDGFAQHVGQPREQIGLARGRRAGLAGVVVVGHMLARTPL